ncbi:MAG: hypothetical protein WCF97_07780 [Nitrososphaeraceae archaeon]
MTIEIEYTWGSVKNITKAHTQLVKLRYLRESRREKSTGNKDINLILFADMCK